MREAQRIAENFLDRLSSLSPDEACVIVGCGWGYIVEALLAFPAAPPLPGPPAPDFEKNAGGPANFTQPRTPGFDPAGVIFFEPLASACDCLRDSDRFAELTKRGATIICDPERLSEFAHAKSARRLHVLTLPVYQRLFPDLESALHELLGGSTMAEQQAAQAPAATIDRATGGRFLRQWTRNAILRIASRDGRRPEAKSDFEFLAPPIGDLAGPAIENTPGEVLFCGAGPRLLFDLGLGEKQARSGRRTIAELRRRFFIVAADTAVAPLLAAGLVPDLAISVDSGPGTYYHLAAASRSFQKFERPAGARFAFPVLSNLAGPRCLTLFFERRVYYRTSMPLDQWLGEGPLREIPELQNPARNAIGLALHVARLLGAARVRTAGADFRSLGPLTHVRGTGYTEFARERVQRLYSLEMYQPGGYVRRDAADDRRTSKNEISHQNARHMADLLRLDLAELKPGLGFPDEAAAEPAGNDATTPRELPRAALRRVNALELGGFLRETRPQLNEKVFEDRQLPAVDLDRWFQTLN